MDDPPDLGAVGELCRLALVARRLGCRVRLEGVSPELRALLDLAGVDAVLIDADAPDPGPSTDRSSIRCTS